MKLGPHTVVILRAGTKPSGYGNRTEPDWDDPVPTTVEGCSVQPANTSEFTTDRDSFTTRHVAFLPASTDVRSTDRAIWNGDTYEVDGDVLTWDYGPLSHLVINLRRSQDT